MQNTLLVHNPSLNISQNPRTWIFFTLPRLCSSIEHYTSEQETKSRVFTKLLLGGTAPVLTLAPLALVE